MREIKHYSKDTIDQLPWPSTSEGTYAKNFLVPLIREGTNTFVDNIHTKMSALLIDDAVIPITVNEAEYSNSYLCSPSSQYVGFGRELFGKKNWVLQKCFNALERILQWAHFNKVVMVNNWLLTTNLYPKLTFEQISTISAFLRETFLGYTIMFRSVNPTYDQFLFDSLNKLGYSLFLNRLVYTTEGSDCETFRSRMFKSDLKILKNSPYTVLENDQITEEHFERIVHLYRYLYIDKYSAYNPRFNIKFIELALKSRALQFKALCKEGTIDAVMGYFTRRNIITSPFFGYDTSLPQELGLYRQLSTLLALEAQRGNFLLNYSSGAASFKTLRRARAVKEYIAIDTRAAPHCQKVAWSLIKNMMKIFAESLIKNAGL